MQGVDGGRDGQKLVYEYGALFFSFLGRVVLVVLLYNGRAVPAHGRLPLPHAEQLLQPANVIEL